MRGWKPHLPCAGRSRSRATTAGKMPASPGEAQSNAAFLCNAPASDHHSSEQPGNRTSDHRRAAGTAPGPPRRRRPLHDLHVLAYNLTKLPSFTFPCAARAVGYTADYPRIRPKLWTQATYGADNDIVRPSVGAIPDRRQHHLECDLSLARSIDKPGKAVRRPSSRVPFG